MCLRKNLHRTVSVTLQTPQSETEMILTHSVQTMVKRLSCTCGCELHKKSWQTCLHAEERWEHLLSHSCLQQQLSVWNWTASVFKRKSALNQSAVFPHLRNKMALTWSKNCIVRNINLHYHFACIWS